jgi:hypothetical protein
MAQATNLTIKKADGTTDITYTVRIASGGDKSPAIWEALTVSALPNARPTLAVESAWNGAKTARRVNMRFEYPYSIVNSDGTTTIVNRELGTATWIQPQDIPDSHAEEAAAQFANLIATALIKSTMATGYAPV